MHNEECHLSFCLFHPNLKLAIRCNYFPYDWYNWSWVTREELLWLIVGENIGLKVIVSKGIIHLPSFGEILA